MASYILVTTGSGISLSPLWCQAITNTFTILSNVTIQLEPISMKYLILIKIQA